MGTTQLRKGLPAFAGMLILILDSKTALAGAAEGIGLCIRTVIPSLFPFFVLTNLLTDALMGARLSVLKILGRLFRIPEGAESILLSGFLGGYPAGAHCLAAACKAGTLDIRDGRRLLCCCNNPGPAFLFGMLLPHFPNSSTVWQLWGITVLSSLLYAQLTPAPHCVAVKAHSVKAESSDALWSAIRAMALVCGWVILFRIVLVFLEGWILWILPGAGQVFVSGILELANGCCNLGHISDHNLRFLLCAVMLSFGGVCVTMQTMSVAAGIFHFGYLWAKLVQACFSLILSSLLIGQKWTGLFLFNAAILVFSRIRQKNVAISGSVMYNTHTT